MTTNYDNDALLMGSGGRSARFENKGDKVEGTIMRVTNRQRTEMGSGAPMVWPDGNPKMQLVIQLLTENTEDDDDDGMRNLYVAIPSQMQKAIADAVRTSGQNGLGAGGILAVQFFNTKEPETRGYSPQKLYRARYSPPTVSAENTSGYESGDDDIPF